MRPVRSVLQSLNIKKAKVWSMWGKYAVSEWEINWPIHRQNMQAWLQRLNTVFNSGMCHVFVWSTYMDRRVCHELVHSKQLTLFYLAYNHVQVCEPIRLFSSNYINVHVL